MRRLAAAVLLWILPAALCSTGMAQTDGTTTLKVDVKTVLLPVTVRDKHGKLIENLTKTDFALTEDSKAEAINYFATNANLPLTLGLLVDTSGSVRSVLAEEKAASQHFLETMMSNEKDSAFVIQFDREVELLQDLTSSKDKLRKALDEVGTAPPAPPDGGTGDPDDTSSGSGQPRARRGGGTKLYDAIYLAANELMSKQQGRKALIVLTDGEDRGSKESLNMAIEAAQRANTTIYAIYFKGEGHGGGGSPGGGHHGGGYPGGGGGYPGGGAGAIPAAGEVGIRVVEVGILAAGAVANSTWMARRSCNRCAAKRAAQCSRRRSRNLMRYMRPSPRSLGTSTCLGIRRRRRKSRVTTSWA